MIKNQTTEKLNKAILSCDEMHLIKGGAGLSDGPKTFGGTIIQLVHHGHKP